MKKVKRLLLFGVIAFFVGTVTILNENTEMLGFFLMLAGVILLVAGIVLAAMVGIRKIKGNFSGETPESIAPNNQTSEGKAACEKEDTGRKHCPAEIQSESTDQENEKNRIFLYPQQAPAEINGYELNYHYKDININVEWKYRKQNGDTCQSIGVSRGDRLALIAEPHKNYWEDKTDDESISVYWHDIRLGVMRKNRLRNMVHQWQDEGLPIFCAVTDTGVEKPLYVEFGFYGVPTERPDWSQNKNDTRPNDDQEYRQFTTPAELQKAVNTLSGMVAGLSSDNSISESEINELVHWCTLHENLRSRHPFSELLPIIYKALEDGEIEEEEQKDILWVCSNYTSNSKYYDIITSSIQFLNGFLQGSMADGELSDSEIAYLKAWLEDNQSLSGTYPYDELYSLTSSILEDNKITQEEREMLMAFASNLIEFKDSYNLVESDFVKLRETYSVQGICNSYPEISFKDKLFCFTGDFYKGTRDELIQEVEKLGGVLRSGVSKKTDYLVVGNGGNPCWAYSCYGRKIEEGMALRKNGAKLQIVSEDDFWSAVDRAQTATV